MSRIFLEYASFRFEYPAKTEPQWKNLVDRWYQLDAFAYGLAQGYWLWKEAFLPHPALLFLASPGASNETDYKFVSSGASSPAKFTHTLPNVRGSSLCQVMGWAGEVFCVQRDPQTQVTALSEAAEWLGSRYPRIWIMSVEWIQDAYVARGWVLKHEGQGLELLRSGDTGTPVSDLELCSWLDQVREAKKPLDSLKPEGICLLHGWEIRYTS